MPDTDASMTIEQLAHEVGMSVRNIRNHQTRGLLPPPEVRARTGFYGRAHVDRLRLIQEMQAEGLKLTAIERLVGGGGDWAERFAGLRRAIAVPLGVEASEIITLAELEERFGPVDADPRPLAKAQKLGVLIPLGDGTFEVPSPALLRAAEEVVARGVPLPAALAAIERVQRHAESAARAFVRLFMDELWKPFNAAGRPEEQWPQITESIERLRPLAAETVVALFKPLLAEEIEDAFGKAIETQAKRKS
jgi:DNA-binding transcriptional MerR regulator